MSAYHTDRSGLYNPPDSATRVPRLRGVAVTDEEGRFGFVPYIKNVRVVSTVEYYLSD